MRWQTWMLQATSSCEGSGARLRAFRIANGLSQRALTERIGLSAHSNLTDYELGRRLPPADVIAACEQVLDVPGGELRRLRDAVLVARADGAGSPSNRDPGLNVASAQASDGAAIADIDVVGSPIPAAGLSRFRRVAIVRAAAATVAVAVASAAALLLTVTVDSPSHHGAPPLLLAAGSGTTHVSTCDDGAVILESDVVDGALPAADGRPRGRRSVSWRSGIRRVARLHGRGFFPALQPQTLPGRSC